MKLFERTRIPLLSSALDAYAARNRVNAENISNMNTVGYKAKSVNFEEALSQAVQGTTLSGTRTHERHIAIGSDQGRSIARIEEVRPDAPGDEYRNGINNVDIDHEMAELAKNQIRFKFSARLLGESFRGIQKSIKGQL